MNKYWLSGIIFRLWIGVSRVFIRYRHINYQWQDQPPTCSMDIVNSQPQQHCGQVLQSVDFRHRISSPVKGVTTELVAAGNGNKRQIVLNRYD